jgi:hypothetical protein
MIPQVEASGAILIASSQPDGPGDYTDARKLVSLPSEELVVCCECHET